MHCEQDIIYRYDGSFAGFLCCVFESVQSKRVPFAIVPTGDPNNTLFFEQWICTDAEKANRVQASFAKKMGGEAPLLIAHAFLCGNEGKELAILRFLLLGYQVGAAVCTMHGHPDVAPLRKMERSVRKEAHLLTGFLRFVDYGCFLGATIDPKHYVLPLLRTHFCDRFPQEHFVIYDRTHSSVLLYEPYSARFEQLCAPLVFPSVCKKEREFSALWKAFCESISIQQRENPAVQKGLCPKRFWGTMPEMTDLL